jgi:heme oxygenase (biliverdin-producing, ferredoxin)
MQAALPMIALAVAWQGSAPFNAAARQGYHRPAAVAVRMLTEQEERVSQAMDLKPVAEQSARSTGLALALDDGTRKSHSVAENTAFVTGFFRGIATKPSFAQLVSSLYFVYAEMEDAFDKTSDPSVRALDYPALRRRAALEEDMAYFFGSEWRTTVTPSAATRKYVERVQQVAQSDPYLLVAHMYTRYLGDLFGGQMMGGMARRSLELEPGAGTAFYEFDQIPSTKPFIEQWYAELNELELSEEQKNAIVDEGNLVFALNIEFFEELDGNPLQSLWTLASTGLRRALNLK